MCDSQYILVACCHVQIMVRSLAKHPENMGRAGIIGNLLDLVARRYGLPRISTRCTGLGSHEIITLKESPRQPPLLLGDGREYDNIIIGSFWRVST